MIYVTHSAFRTAFASSLTPGVDGLPAWPVALVRAAGFDAGIEVIVGSTFLFLLTVNAEANDASPGVQEYDWYVSRRTDDPARYPFQVLPVTNKSGTIELNLLPPFDTLFPIPFLRSIIDELWPFVHVYVRRRSDGAIQVLDLRQYITDNLVVEDEEV